MPDLNEIYTSMRSTWEEMKAANEKAIEEAKKLAGEATGETKAEIMRVNEALEARLDVLEAAQNRPAVASGEEVKSASADERMKAFITALRTHPDNYRYLPEETKSLAHPLKVAEVKAMNLSDDTTGGFLAPPEFVNEMIRPLVQQSPWRNFVRVRPTASRSITIPTRSGNTAAKWITELATRSDTGNFKIGMDEIPTMEMVAESVITEQDLEDAEFDIEAELRRDFAEQFGLAEALAILSGNGKGKPEGIVANPVVAALTTATPAGYTMETATADTLIAADLIAAVYDLPDPYAADARMFLHRKTIGFLRGIKDATGATSGEGNFLWQPGLSASEPATILGMPYTTVPNMAANPIGQTPVTGDKLVIIGNLARAYILVDRVQLAVKRLNELGAQTGQIIYMARKRIGGQVVLPEAIRVLQVK